MSDEVVGGSLGALKALIASIEGDFVLAQKGNRAAGTRVRKMMQEVRKAAVAVREEVIVFRDLPREKKPRKAKVAKSDEAIPAPTDVQEAEVKPQQS